MERGAKSKKDGTSKTEPKSTKRKTDAVSATGSKSSKRRDEGNAGKKTPRRETPESARGDNSGGPRREKTGGEDLERPWREVMERNTEKLFEYVKKGQTYNIEEFIRLGADVNGRDEEGRTPLIRAAELRNNTVQTILMAKNVKVNASDKLKRRALHFESAHGDTESVKQLLAHGADIDARDYEGHTPLHYAVNRNHLSTVDILVFCGADGRAKDSKRASPESICEPGPMQTLLLESRDVIYAIRQGYISIHRTLLTSNTMTHLDTIGLRIKTPADFSKTDVCILCRRVRPEYSRCGLGPINKELLISDTFEFRLSGSRFKGQVKMLVPMYTKPEPYEEVHIKTSKKPKLLESSRELVLYEREESSNQWICSVDVDIKEISSFVLVTRPRVEHFKVGQQGGTFVSDVDSFIKIDIPQKSFSDKGDLTLEVVPRPAYTNEELGVKQIEVTSVSNIYEVNHTRNEQPQNEVTVTLPLPRDYQQENTNLYVLSRRNPTEDESELSLWEIVSVNPDQAYGRMTFKTSHFSSELAIACAMPRSDTPDFSDIGTNYPEEVPAHRTAKGCENKTKPQEQEPKKLNQDSSKEGLRNINDSKDIKNSKTTKTLPESKTERNVSKDNKRRGSNVSQASNRSQMIKGYHSGSDNDKVNDDPKSSDKNESQEIRTTKNDDSEKQPSAENEMKRKGSSSSSQTSLHKDKGKEKDTSMDEEVDKQDEEALKDVVNSTSQANSEEPKRPTDGIDGNAKSFRVDDKQTLHDKETGGSKTSLKSISSRGNASKTSIRKDKHGMRPKLPSQGSSRSSQNGTIEDTRSETRSLSRRSQKMTRGEEREVKKTAVILYDKAMKRQCKVSFVVMLNGNSQDDKYETLVECTMKDPYKRLSFWETEGFQDQKPSFPERKEFNVIPKTFFEFPVSEAAKVLDMQKLEFHPKRKDDNFIRFMIERTEQTKSKALLKIIKKADQRPDNSEDEVFGRMTLHLDGVDAVEKKSAEKAKEMKEFTNDSFLEKISNQLSDEWYKLGVFLGLAKSTLDKKDIPLKERKFKMLTKWRNNCRTREDRGVRNLTLALNRAGRRDVEEFVVKELDSWLEKHKKEDDAFIKWLKRARSGKWEVPEGKVMPYSQEFLMCLVDQLGLREDLLVLLGLLSPQINNVKDPNFYPTPERQMFELLCQAKRRYGSELEFFKGLDMNLGELKLTDVQLWLRDTTAEWCAEHGTEEENMVVDQLQSFLEEVEHGQSDPENRDQKQDLASRKMDQKQDPVPGKSDKKEDRESGNIDQRQDPVQETRDQKQEPDLENTNQNPRPSPEDRDENQRPLGNEDQKQDPIIENKSKTQDMFPEKIQDGPGESKDGYQSSPGLNTELRQKQAVDNAEEPTDNSEGKAVDGQDGTQGKQDVPPGNPGEKEDFYDS